MARQLQFEKQLHFSFHGSVTIDDVTRSAMQDDGLDPDNPADVADWLGGHRELCAMADVHDYSIS
jgi:hypothetical protein